MAQNQEIKSDLANANSTSGKSEKSFEGRQAEITKELARIENFLAILKNGGQHSALRLRRLLQPSKK